MRPWLLLLCALSSCVPMTRDRWLTEMGARSEGLCWWRAARWEDRGTLLARATGEPFARARARWNGELWRGANATAVLRRAGPVVLLQGQWSGPGLTLEADVDVTSQAVFRAFEPMRVGAAGMLLKGGHLRLTDAITGRALAVPAEDSLRSFHSDVPVGLDVACSELSLAAAPELGGDPARLLLKQVGFPQNAPERWLPGSISLPASAEFGGATVGHFVSQRTPVRGFMVEERGGEARLAVPTRGGVVWVAWVPAADLDVPVLSEVEGPPAIVAQERAVAPGEESQASRQWRACEGAELPLSIQSHGSVVEVGSLKAGTRFSIVARRGEYREVMVAVKWLELEPGIRLLAPARASDCEPAKQLDPW